MAARQVGADRAPQDPAEKRMLDVLVVGGGPTGFLTALGLAQAGLNVRLVEAEGQIIDSPRACVYHWSVLDGLEALGVRQEAETLGFSKNDYGWLRRETGDWMRYDLSVLGAVTDFPYNIHLGQDRLADIGRRRLSAMSNAGVRFGTRFVGLTQDAEEVTAQVVGPDGPEEIRARWLVGADGASSNVRKALGLDFPGMTWGERFVATNVYHDFEGAGYPLSTLVVDAQYGAVIVKIATDGLWRCTYMEDATLPEESVLERLPAAYEALLPGKSGYRLERAAPYRMHQRCAERFRVGRVLLAGDAAHVTNPTGGLGLTTGLFDCFALYPVLAAVANGADEAFLDRYDEARRRIFLERTSPQATANKRLVFHANGGGAALEEGWAALKRMETDADYRLQRLMFVKSLETPILDGAPA
ncbi:MAG: FAD-dependent monooxygenase [Sphingobium sp.]|nr:FAD-dependent monooxygenase [Sphingobium sp.]